MSDIDQQARLALSHLRPITAPPSATIGDREFGNAPALEGKRHVEISILPYIATHTNRAPALPAMHVADDANEHQSWSYRI
jgi:hypothetical protein